MFSSFPTTDASPLGIIRHGEILEFTLFSSSFPLEIFLWLLIARRRLGRRQLLGALSVILCPKAGEGVINGALS